MQNYHKYLLVTQREKDWGFYISTVGCSVVSPNQQYPQNEDHPANHLFTWNKGRILDGYYLIFIAKGEGLFESAHSEPTIVKAGTCFLLFPGVWHRYKPNKKSGWEEYWVGFNGTYPEKLMHSPFFSTSNPVIHTGHNVKMLGLFQKLIDSVRVYASGYHQEIPGIALQLLGLVQGEQIPESKTRGSAHLIEKAKFLMQENLEQPLDMHELVKKIPMGYSSFRKSFREITGLSPTQYHINLRIEKARDLLANTHLQINEVAGQVGFESVFYFSRVFSKRQGISPREFRSQGA